jgi:hypothetical protein
MLQGAGKGAWGLVSRLAGAAPPACRAASAAGALGSLMAPEGFGELGFGDGGLAIGGLAIGGLAIGGLAVCGLGVGVGLSIPGVGEHE